MKRMAPDTGGRATDEMGWSIGEAMLGPTPDSKEPRRLLRNAAAMLAASDLESPQRLVLAQRARTYLADAVRELDRLLCVLAEPVPSAIADAPTERHDAAEIELPTLRLPRRGH